MQQKVAWITSTRRKEVHIRTYVGNCKKEKAPNEVVTILVVIVCSLYTAERNKNQEEIKTSFSETWCHLYRTETNQTRPFVALSCNATTGRTRPTANNLDEADLEGKDVKERPTLA